METRRVLISGGGIAGLTLAYWLRRRGMTPVVVEVAPQLRGGGYMIDFWGAGFDVAERMGIVPQLAEVHHDIPALDFIDEAERVRSRFSFKDLRALLGGRHFSLLRSGLARVLHDQVKDDVEIRFGTSIRALRPDEDGVEVDLVTGDVPCTERFDLVVGADGLRSATRRMLFGPDARFERYLGYYTASYTVANTTGKTGVFQSLSAPGRQVGLYSVGHDRFAAFFIFADEAHTVRRAPAEQHEALRRAFGALGWRTPGLLDAMESATDFYFDAVSQIDLPRWSLGRVGLVGDACQCVSLISGQGSALAMAGAYTLAGELAAQPSDPAAALARYEATLRPVIAWKQQQARRFASSFVPGSRLGIAARDGFVKLMFLPGVSKLFLRQFASDTLKLQEY